MIEEFSLSDSDSLTEKNITVGSNEIENYGPDYTKEQIEIVNPKKKAEEKKLRDMRPRTPPKTEAPLVSNFGPKPIPLTQPKDMSQTANIGQKLMTPVDVGRLNQTAGAIQPTPLNQSRLTPLTPAQKESLFMTPIKSEEPKMTPRIQEIPKEGNLLTPSLGTGFAGGEFEKALKEAKDTQDYNFIKYS